MHLFLLLRFVNNACRKLKKQFTMNRNMIKLSLPLLLSLIITSCNYLPESWIDAISGATYIITLDANSLYHQTDEISLEKGELEIAGEVEGAGKVNFRNYFKREVYIKKSTYNKEEGVKFVGAYRYRGYSLFDLLHNFVMDKKNHKEFGPITDVYIVVENDKGESVVFSWSEIFHVKNPGQVLIATEVAPIEPYGVEVDYPMGDKWKLVAGNDMFANRELENPVKITVYSFDEKEYPIDKDLEPLYSDEISIVFENKDEDFTISPIKRDNDTNITYSSTFYGMRMGYRPKTEFTPPCLHSKLEKHIDRYDPEMCRHGLVCFVSIDGYRAIYSYSELFNRTDQIRPILAIPDEGEGGYYRNYHPMDFYADRSVKALAEIYFFKLL